MQLYTVGSHMIFIHSKFNAYRSSNGFRKIRARSFVAIHLNNMAKSSVAALRHLCDADTFGVNEENDVVQKNGALLLNIVIVKLAPFLLLVGYLMPTSNANLCLSRRKEFT